MSKITIAPSVLSANFVDLKADLKKCLDSNIEWIHYDVMDYDFVPNLTFGSKILKDIVDNFNFNIDIHFMVKVKTKKFEDFFKEYIKCKPKMMTMHIESINKNQIKNFINICKTNNILASLAISPQTKCTKIIKYLDKIDNVLVMSVNPGFGGQKFIDSSLEKVRFLKHFRQENSLDYQIEIDGGINDKTAKESIKSGVDMLVAGSYLFESKNMKESVEKIKNV